MWAERLAPPQKEAPVSPDKDPSPCNSQTSSLGEKAGERKDRNRLKMLAMMRKIKQKQRADGQIDTVTIGTISSVNPEYILTEYITGYTV